MFDIVQAQQTTSCRWKKLLMYLGRLLYALSVYSFIQCQIEMLGV